MAIRYCPYCKRNVNTENRYPLHNLIWIIPLTVLFSYMLVFYSIWGSVATFDSNLLTSAFELIADNFEYVFIFVFAIPFAYVVLSINSIRCPICKTKNEDTTLPN